MAEGNEDLEVGARRACMASQRGKERHDELATSTTSMRSELANGLRSRRLQHQPLLEVAMRSLTMLIIVILASFTPWFSSPRGIVIVVDAPLLHELAHDMRGCAIARHHRGEAPPGGTSVPAPPSLHADAPRPSAAVTGGAPWPTTARPSSWGCSTAELCYHGGHALGYTC